MNISQLTINKLGYDIPSVTFKMSCDKLNINLTLILLHYTYLLLNNFECDVLSGTFEEGILR